MKSMFILRIFEAIGFCIRRTSSHITVIITFNSKKESMQNASKFGEFNLVKLKELMHGFSELK